MSRFLSGASDGQRDFLGTIEHLILYCIKSIGVNDINTIGSVERVLSGKGCCIKQKKTLCINFNTSQTHGMLFSFSQSDGCIQKIPHQNKYRTANSSILVVKKLKTVSNLQNSNLKKNSTSNECFPKHAALAVQHTRHFVKMGT